MMKRMSPEGRTATKLVGVVITMGALSWAAVPFYDWFCRVTGFGGTTQVSAAAPDLVLEEIVRVRFDANTDPNLPWTFRPMQNRMDVRIGENGQVRIGWACATGGVSIESLLMFALIFFWTPPHFWALALFMRDDYKDAGVPMLTVTHGRAVTRRHIFAYTLVLAPFSLWLGFTSVGGPLYLAVAVVLNAAFIRGGWQILQRSEDASRGDDFATEKRVFKLSLTYLFLHFLALLGQNWLGAW